MKWILATMGLICISGCQSFRYYEPSTPHRGKDRFYNNYNNDPHANVWKWQWARLTNPNPPEPPYQPEIVKTDLSYLQNNSSEATLTWIGHASTLLQVDGANILMDPVFSDRVSPVSFMGPKRLVAVPFQISDLPVIDAVLISHAHYDHLDLPSLKALASRQNNKTIFLVPLGVAALLKSEGIENVQERDWWEESSLKNLKITFTPAQHWTQRGLFDRNKTLWGGWHVKSSKLKVLYTGDTGYSKDFIDIKSRLGDIDVALIPIGAYEPRWFMKQQHVNPEEAVQIHHDLKARLSIGIHWGTFKLSDETMLGPPQDLKTAMDKNPAAGTEFRVLKHGETLPLNF